MVAIKPKTLVDMRMRGVGESHSRTRIIVRDVAAVVDEPVARGGTNQGPTPTETLMSALISCTNVIASRIAEKKGVAFHDLQIDAHALFDRRGAGLEAEIEVPFPEITLSISVRTNATPEQMTEIQAELGKFCPIAKVIRASGSRITEVWTARPA